MYGDLLETILMYVEGGHILDFNTAGMLVELANLCADQWHCKDAGMWELEEEQHYTMSKLGCWFALDRAVKLAEKGHIPDTMQKRWKRERDRIRDWIDEHCWSEAKQAYTFYAGTDKLDAGILLAIRFGFESKQRLITTCEAIHRELARGPLVYRYSGAEKEEGAFLACSFWLVESYAVLGDNQRAKALMEDVLKVSTNGIGLMTEMMDPQTGEALGNFPQGLSHLAMIHAILAVDDPAKTES
ncbi:glycoside hydrolase family 15 protein [Pseudomonas luteola]|uniref:glycoside hydrolase family 15 protein n=1 Tax=Pseudomonas luteola TaxID=47886 RepID=UPI0022B5D2C2|nr:glycoside hydrolase family 15 protein [Pseudomonas luteola]